MTAPDDARKIPERKILVRSRKPKPD